MALPPQFLEELRSRLSVSEVVMKRMRLQRAGREFKAPCPFHNEKTPSFYVNDQKNFFHCLAGETGVLLEDGIKPIRSLVGTTQRVLTRGGHWVEAAFKAYGVQRLFRITLTRNGQRKELYATDGHRWFVRGVESAVLTRDLRPGHRLEAVLPAARDDWTLDPEGVAHGVVFGDGSVQKGYGHVHLHGQKDMALARWFPDQEGVGRVTENGKSYLRIYGGKSFGHMKALPSLLSPPAYLLGFLAGYFAADGHVAKDGTVMLNSARREHLEWVRAAATRIGIGTYGITTARRRGLAREDRDLHRVHFVPATLQADFFLTDVARERFSLSAKRFARLRWVVQSVEATDRIEEVYCAEVPEHHAFALEDNILTGNCFGCGAHGDQIGFVMRHDNLSFMEAVEHLAAEAGMQVPQATPQERQQYERQKSLYDLVEQATRYYERELYTPGGRAALDYLRRRGLNDEAIARFRLGYAPQDGAPLRSLLSEADYSEADMVEVGLFKRPEAGRAIRNFFWNRVMFPVTDRRGQVVAFGGRVLEGDGPKYINSAENPLFHKGNLLYGMSRARQAASDGQKLIVTEGYMDVISCVLAGFEGAVAPLGTAMTETQIQVLWKLAPEGQRNPILCFDGDNAGRRAAMRAVERVLPILTPDATVRIAFMPDKEDPDSLIRSGGREAFQGVLDRALSLEDFIWELIRQGEDPKTADGRLRIEAGINQMMEKITDKSVQYSYRSVLREKLRAAIRAGGGGFGGTGGGGPGRPRRQMPGEVPVSRLWDSRFRSATLRTEPRRREPYLLLTVIHHPELFQDIGETLAGAEFADGEMEALRQALVACLTTESALDADGLKRHLSSRGFQETLDSLLSADAPKFAQPGASMESARSGWQEVWLSSEDSLLQRELRDAEKRFAETFSEDDLARLRALQRELLILRGHADNLTEMDG